MGSEYFASPVKLTLTLKPTDNPIPSEPPPASAISPRRNPTPAPVAQRIPVKVRFDNYDPLFMPRVGTTTTVTIRLD